MIASKFKLGQPYTRSTVGSIIGDDRVAISREGLFYTPDTTILFVTLDKANKDESHRYNDYFEGEFFHWDSQNNQHQRSPKIVQIINDAVDVVLFARIHDKVKGVTQPFLYCGRLVTKEVDRAANNPTHILFEALDYDPEARGVLREIYHWDPRSKGLPVATTISAKGKMSRRAARQGTQIDPKVRKLVETRAMKMAAAYYEKRGYSVEDTSATQPYDLVCRAPGVEFRVEVKGTQTLGEGVIVTRNEVEAARLYGSKTHLFIVHSIEVERTENGYRVSGGRLRLIRDWQPADSDLSPIQFMYSIPPKSLSDESDACSSPNEQAPDSVLL